MIALDDHWPQVLEEAGITLLDLPPACDHTPLPKLATAAPPPDSHPPPPPPQLNKAVSIAGGGGGPVARPVVKAIARSSLRIAPDATVPSSLVLPLDRVGVHTERERGQLRRCIKPAGHQKHSLNNSVDAG